MFQTMRLVVVSGPTREWIDPVRYISNASSGRTGWELARAGLSRFASVLLISGPGEEQFRALHGAETRRVETTADMAEATAAAIGDDCLLIMAAAPADFRPSNPASSKIKKTQTDMLRLDLAPTTDILRSLIPRASGLQNLIRVGFAAETDNLLEYAAAKMKAKDLDFICANEVFRDQQGFGDRVNTIFLIDRAGNSKTIGPLKKSELAPALLDQIESAMPQLLQRNNS
ncbi:MAG: phosphopantothenoylcysteine decarboxylase [Leptospirales bacterium]|nr:phosphopantothenoylcysteine decarboxylase [Leptospirales bacterium]